MISRSVPVVNDGAAEARHDAGTICCAVFFFLDDAGRIDTDVKRRSHIDHWTRDIIILRGWMHSKVGGGRKLHGPTVPACDLLVINTDRLKGQRD